MYGQPPDRLHTPDGLSRRQLLSSFAAVASGTVLATAGFGRSAYALEAAAMPHRRCHRPTIRQYGSAGSRILIVANVPMSREFLRQPARGGISIVDRARRQRSSRTEAVFG